MAMALSHIFELQEQICYVECNFCTTILVVSVPLTSLSMVVTVKCGHCTSLLSVNMTKASFLPFHLLAALNNPIHNPELKERDDDQAGDNVALCRTRDMQTSLKASSEEHTCDNDEDMDHEIPIITQSVPKPPEKKKRAPSAYNRFIKEEIRRLKVTNPGMTHKEAFSTAAKNWAYFPSVQKEDGDHDIQQEDDKAGTRSN